MVDENSRFTAICVLRVAQDEKRSTHASSVRAAAGVGLTRISDVNKDLTFKDKDQDKDKD